jgi:hypothetical protein
MSQGVRLGEILEVPTGLSGLPARLPHVERSRADGQISAVTRESIQTAREEQLPQTPMEPVQSFCRSEFRQ